MTRPAWSAKKLATAADAPCLDIYDARSRHGKNLIHANAARIFRGDVRSFHEWIDFTGRDHLHHRFEALFKSKRFSVCMVFLLTVCLGLSATIIRHVELDIAFLVLFQCVIVLVLVTILEHAGNLCERRKTFPFQNRGES